MSTKAVAAVLDAQIRPAYVKLVATVLAFHCNDETGHAWPSMSRLARACSCSERQAKRAVAQLRQEGLVRIVRESSGGTRRATVVYEFDFEALSKSSAAGDTGVTPGVTPARPVETASREQGHKDSVTPASPHKGHRRHPRGDTGVTLGGARASPKRDERKAKPSLSSKRRPTPDTGDTARSRVPSPAPGAAASTGKRSLTADDPRVWMNDDALLSAKGVSLGFVDLDAAMARGKTRIDYSRDVIAAFAARRREAQSKRPASGLTRGGD